PPGTVTYVHSMCMYSKGPVSTRCALTVWEVGSAVRRDTQLHTLPFSSGCIVSRKSTLSPSRSRIVASAYSVKRSGQLSTSLVIVQTSSIGAEITTSFSVWPATAVLPPLSSDVRASRRWPASPVFGVDVAEFRSRGEGPQVEYEESLFSPGVGKPVADVDRDQDALPRRHRVRLPIQADLQPASDQVKELL